MTASPGRHLLISALVVLTLWNGNASATPAFSALYVFGDSLVDGGNVRLLLDSLPTPPDNTVTPVSGNDFIPTAPYDRGAGLSPAFTDRQNLAEQVAANLGLPAPTPFLAGGTNVAFGSARMAAGADVVPGVPEQVNRFIARLDAMSPPPGGPDAPADGLYLIAAGSNDVSDAADRLFALETAGASDAVMNDALTQALTDYAFGLAGAVGDLVLEGARNFIILNVPDIGLTPAIRAQGPDPATRVSDLAAAFNQTYLNVMDFLDDQFAATGFDDVDLVRFDIAGLLRDAAANPAAFGFDNVNDACAADPVCLTDPTSHLYWDGIHPTSLGHAVAASAMALALQQQAPGVPAPSTLLLVLPAIALTRAGNRTNRQAHRARKG